MKHNQFAYKLINGKVTNKFCRIENKIIYSYLDKNGNKKVDYNERKIRIQNERKNIEQNIINDLYLALGWNNSGLKQNVPIGKYTPDFFDSNKKIISKLQRLIILITIIKKKNFLIFYNIQLLLKLINKLKITKNP